MLNKYVLVTGGAGYVGSHVCKLLAANGYVPVCYDSMLYGHEWAVKWGPLIQGDIRDRKPLIRTFEQYRPVAVIHFAALTYVGESVQDPGKYYHNNVVGTISLLETMREYGCQKILFSSTAAVYGIPDVLPIRETAPKIPVNPYGRTKLMIEQILQDYDMAYGIRHVILRYFNAAGADPDGEIGEWHFPETHLIPIVIEAAMSQTVKVQVFGTDYDTPDGTAIRDYIHVTDLARAHWLGLNLLETDDQSHVFNLGTGHGHSVMEVIHAVERVSGRPVNREMGPRRPGDPPKLVASADKARSVLGWHPSHTHIDEIVATALNWYLHGDTIRHSSAISQ